MRASRWWLLLLLALVVLVSSCAMRRVEAAVGIEPPQKLQWHYYRNSCRDAERYVRTQVEFYWKLDKSLAPKLIRMLYADCFVTGCDASILLDGPYSEKTAPQSAGFLGFPMVVIDKIKQILEERCPGVVSCADILNFAARDAAHLAGGPSYPVLAGRRDGMSSSAASVDLPLGAALWGSALAYFESRGLDVLDLTTLLGGHSLGKTNCSVIADRLYNFNKTGKPDPSMDSSFLAQMRVQCPPNSKNQVYLDPDSGSSYSFSKSFYSRVLNHRAVLGIDQQIAANNDSSQIAQQYDGSFEDFRKRFALSMSRMGNIKVLTGNQGEIRKNCRVVNRK
ncbi:probable peroxidase 61 [Eucalyptus grandis]|uniref:probable peroxidase 61 n=1 Tax=Eucalyptus grandis TaxID=71139 RepID=UPI00192EB50A|nr:probable peroxidase 61 [Eucalyptus grandis]